MKKYAYLGTNKDLAEKYASLLHDLLCTDDMIECQRLVETLHVISSQIRLLTVSWEITDVYTMGDALGECRK